MAEGQLDQWRREYAAGKKRREDFTTLSFEEVPALGETAFEYKLTGVNSTFLGGSITDTSASATSSKSVPPLSRKNHWARSTAPGSAMRPLGQRSETVSAWLGASPSSLRSKRPAASNSQAAAARRAEP